MFPNDSLCMRAVTARFVTNRDNDESSVFHALDFPVGDAEFGRIDEIVRGVDVHDVRGNFLELG